MRFLTGSVLQLATGPAAVGALPTGHWPQALWTYSAVEQQMWALPKPKENNGSNPHKQIFLYWDINIHTSSAIHLQSVLPLVGHVLWEKQVMGSHASHIYEKISCLMQSLRSMNLWTERQCTGCNVTQGLLAM